MTGLPVARRVLLVDDHRVLTDLLVSTIAVEPDLECVGVADDIPTALALATAARPDTAVVDARLPSGDGVALAGRLAELLPGLRVVVLTAHPRPEAERAALKAGAVGYLGKDSPLATVLQAVRVATPDRPALDPRLRARDRAAGRMLTPRERDVLRLLADGRHATQIAAELGLSTHTTRDYIKALLAKLGARSQLEAVATAARHGLVRIGEP